ncbi:class I SAM-dependent RNA methyltransferase [Paramagnetospirillum kuznetsovii]|uniref:Class I SAM-dependent RNA methyltransferase n=1 Tax=Paramagnetospirillum kuznetsovii TaxID=2053833 RepID=A0A364NXR7_9PROT|nr:class I SAM-dependent RNA methyltransferase [Paramagnetospirillum kuznetsovii]RAU21707.1 class I SAM-dependent RNA methyltransferase [Paramagnetospirillum kuznetsovii]
MRKPPRRHSGQARKSRAAPPAARTVALVIDEIGARGDGVARLDGEAVFVPFTVSGDRVVARVESRRGDGLAAVLIEVMEPGPDRVEPPCPHFGRCGGCGLQHLADDAYAAWKLDLLAVPLARHGFGDLAIAPLIRVPPASRRRATFAFTRAKGAALLGFNARASHTIIDVERCLLLEPVLVGLLAPLRAMLAAIVPEGTGGDVTATLTEGGLDVLVEAEARLDLFDRERLAAFAESADLARLSWRRPGTGFVEPIARRRPAEVGFSGVMVEPSPGAFLQPTRGGEIAITQLVTAGVTAGLPVLDLYAGCGSFTAPLALLGPVHAVEGEQGPLAALDAAARSKALPITTEVRDLARRPLAAHELVAYRSVVLDPPRAGASAQVAELAKPAAAKGGPRVIVMVSCNPATLARDLRVLADGGWTVTSLTPIDQFPWSAHLESVAILKR